MTTNKQIEEWKEELDEINSYNNFLTPAGAFCRSQEVKKAVRIAKEILLDVIDLQDKLTFAVSVNITMQRLIRELRGESDGRESE